MRARVLFQLGNCGCLHARLIGTDLNGRAKQYLGEKGSFIRPRENLFASYATRERLPKFTSCVIPRNGRSWSSPSACNPRNAPRISDRFLFIRSLRLLPRAGNVEPVEVGDQSSLIFRRYVAVARDHRTSERNSISKCRRCFISKHILGYIGTIFFSVSHAWQELGWPKTLV